MAEVKGETATREIPGGLRPSEVRRRIREEHRELRALLGRFDAPVVQLERGDGSVRPFVAARARSLHDFLLHHLSLEDGLLVPALRDTDGFGNVRAERLLTHHRDQRGQFAELFAIAEDASRPPMEVAKVLRKLMMDLRDDMDQEEVDLLNARLLSDVPTNVDSFTG